MMTAIRVAYLELSNIYEDYSRFPASYAGCSIFARWAKEIYNDFEEIEFYLFAPTNCFKNVNVLEEKADYCIPLDEEQWRKIKEGGELKKIFPNYFENFDIIMHHNPDLYLNLDGLKAKQVIWGPMGTVTEVTEKADHVFYWRKHEKPVSKNQNIYKICLGKPIPDEFVEFKDKKNFLFQCTRHDRQTNTIEVIKQAKLNEIEFIFAGPVLEDELGEEYPGDSRKWYPCLWDVANGIPKDEPEQNPYVKYLGNTVLEEDKLRMTQEARLTTYLFRRNPSFNQSVIESLSLGTPILAPKSLLAERTYSDFMPEDSPVLEDDQFFRNVIIEGETGFYFDGNNFKECYEMALDSSPRKCWEVSKEYSVEKMLDSFSNSIKKVMDT